MGAVAQHSAKPPTVPQFISSFNIMKVFVSMFFVGSSLAMPQIPLAHVGHPVGHAIAHPVAAHVAHPVAHPVAHHAALVAHPAPYVEEAPQPFAYEYGGADEYGRHFAKTEAQDANGVVQGEYRVEQPDGRVRIVTYHADPVGGFVADVRYEGEAIPEPVHVVPHAVPHAVHAAPLVHAAPHAVHAAPLVHAAAPVHAVHAPAHALHAAPFHAAAFQG